MNWRAFIRGAASILDLFGTSAYKRKVFRNDEEAFMHDAEALRGDWQAVLDDIDRATKLLEKDVRRGK